jgi:CheY-like chemotaxis protein
MRRTMFSQRNVLVVEDESSFAQNLLTHLQRRAHRVCVAADGTTAVALALSSPPEVILVDYSLPGIDGLATIKHIVARHRSVGCVLMSGYLTDEVLAAARAAGIRHVLLKPFGLAELDRLLGLPVEEIALAPQPFDPAR